MLSTVDRDFYFWFSIVSLGINVILILISVGLFVANRKEKERRNAQVKIWMQSASGISEALRRIIQDRWNDLYSSLKDVVNSVHTVEAAANSLFQSLYEERTMTEEEYKQEQKRFRDIYNAQQTQQLGLLDSSQSPPGGERE